MLSSPWQQQAQVRCRYPNWLAVRDLKRRSLIRDHYDERVRITAVLRNRTLPSEIRVRKLHNGFFFLSFFLLVLETAN